jgi:hypothetical protein
MTREEANLAYDGRIPPDVLARMDAVEAAERAEAFAAWQRMTPVERIDVAISLQRAAVAATWADMRHTCRKRDGLLCGLLEARRKARAGDNYFALRARTCRDNLAIVGRLLAAQKAKLARLVAERESLTAVRRAA